MTGPKDSWKTDAAHRVRQFLMRAVMNGKNYAPDQTYELSKAGQVGPKSAAIAQIFQRWADMWAQDMRETAAQGIDVDAGQQFDANMRQAVAEVERYLANNHISRAA